MNFHSAQPNEFDFVVSMFVWQRKIEFHYFQQVPEPVFVPERKKIEKMNSLEKFRIIPYLNSLHSSSHFEVRNHFRKMKNRLCNKQQQHNKVSNDENHSIY